MPVLLKIAGICAAGVLLVVMALQLHMSPAVGVREVEVGGTTVQVEVADTEALREAGLSGREALTPGSGMLFVFEEPGVYGFWMKDMNFPIDIIFADAEGTVTTVYGSVSPNTYPQAFYPQQDSLYVLEVSAGFAQAHGITTKSSFNLGL